jgi:histidinol-phosphate aminotransferase
MSYEREVIRRMRGYTWGEQPQDARTIKLNTNENPYPPSPRVATALRAFDVAALRRYPPPTADAFRDRVAARFGVERDEVLVGNGGDELLKLAFTTFLDPGDTFGTTEPSYSLYPVLAEIQGCEVATVRLESDWSMPNEAVARFNEAGARLVCVVNPHAPSGRLVPVERLAGLARDLDGVLLVDEAYVDFVDPVLGHDATALLRTFDNVLLLRTLSKGYSLAGLRLGFALGHRDLIAPMLTKTRDSYNVGTLAQSLACAAFDDGEYAQATWANVRRDRRALTLALRERGFEVPDSQANFLLATMPIDAAVSASGLALALKTSGILVRHFAQPRLDDKLRITIGDPEQNARLIRAIDEAFGRR